MKNDYRVDPILTTDVLKTRKVVKDKRVRTPYLNTGKRFDGHIVKNYLGFVESNDFTTSYNEQRHTDEDFIHHLETTTDIKMKDEFLNSLLQYDDDAIYRPFLYGWSLEDDVFIDPYYKNKNQRL